MSEESVFDMVNNDVEKIPASEVPSRFVSISEPLEDIKSSVVVKVPVFKPQTAVESMAKPDFGTKVTISHENFESSPGLHVTTVEMSTDSSPANMGPTFSIIASEDLASASELGPPKLSTTITHAGTEKPSTSEQSTLSSSFPLKNDQETLVNSMEPSTVHFSTSLESSSLIDENGTAVPSV